MVSELYQLPDGWEWKTIEDLCEILDRLRKPISQIDRISGEYPYYGASGILDYIDNFIFDERLLLIGEDGAKWGANENTSFIADGKYWVNNHAHIIRPNKDLVIDSLLVYYLNATDLDEYITGATVKKLNQQKLKSILIPLPPLEEQKRIVSKLDKLFEKIDKSIALHQKNMDEADVFMGSVLNDVFGELEEKYGADSIGNIATVLNGRAYKKEELLNNGKYRVLRVGNFFTNENWFYSDLELEDNKYCDNGDLLYAWSASFGPKIWMGEKVIFHYHIWKILPSNKITKEYLYHYLDFDVSKIKSELGTGTTMIHITKGSMENRIIPLPPLSIQQKVVKYLDEISEKMEILKRVQNDKMAHLKALKASILDSAFRGEL